MRIEWRLLEAGFCTHPEVMVMRGGAWRPQQFPALVAVLRHPHHGRVLFDTGYSEHFLQATRALPESLYRSVTPVNFSNDRAVRSQLGVNANAVKHVILSHFHGDHVGGLHDFPQARVHCSHAGWNDVRARTRLDALRLGLLPQLLPVDFAARVSFFESCTERALPASLLPFERGFDVFGDGSVFAVALPGHAAGHFGICFRDTQERLVFLIGDAAWSSDALESNRPPPAFVSGWLGDTRAYRDTLARLHELRRRSPEVCLVPAHCRRWRAETTQ